MSSNLFSTGGRPVRRDGGYSARRASLYNGTFRRRKITTRDTSISVTHGTTRDSTAIPRRCVVVRRAPLSGVPGSIAKSNILSLTVRPPDVFWNSGGMETWWGGRGLRGAGYNASYPSANIALDAFGHAVRQVRV